METKLYRCYQRYIAINSNAGDDIAVATLWHLEQYLDITLSDAFFVDIVKHNTAIESQTTIARMPVIGTLNFVLMHKLSSQLNQQLIQTIDEQW